MFNVYIYIYISDAIELRTDTRLFRYDTILKCWTTICLILYFGSSYFFYIVELYIHGYKCIHSSTNPRENIS